MAEPNQTPMAGGPQNTPGGGAPSSASGTDPAPTSGDSTPKIDDFSLRIGFGKGAEKGRKEGVTIALQALGLGDLSLEEAKAKLAKPAPAPQGGGNVRETDEYRSLASEHLMASEKLKAANERLSILEARADVARVEKLRAAALSKGVGPGKQIEAFLALHGDIVRFGQDRELEVLSKMPDGSMVAAGKKVDSWLDEVLKENPFLLKTEGRGGAGSNLQPVGGGPKRSLFGPRRGESKLDKALGVKSKG